MRAAAPRRRGVAARHSSPTDDSRSISNPLRRYSANKPAEPGENEAACRLCCPSKVIAESKESAPPGGSRVKDSKEPAAPPRGSLPDGCEDHDGGVEAANGEGDRDASAAMTASLNSVR